MPKLAHPPLQQFRLRFDFPSIDDPSIGSLSEICKELSGKKYLESIRISLISATTPKRTLQFMPIRFVSKSEDHELLIFNDAIVFTYQKYSTWLEILPPILETFSYLVMQLNIKKLKDIRLDYIDVFDKFSKKNFQIQTYFNISLNIPPDFSITFDDFIIGMNLSTDNPNYKSIIRLRGVQPSTDDFYNIQLETHFSITEEIIIDMDQIKELLDLAHESISKNFKTMLSENTKKIIGM
ncbi:MAG: hypothetical protein RBG13Loki_3810 [Promethearchaeota archaeon CR_4]|nr:MAG: hypothetical protein RBG13Loki_3810 [Candidatus Lokiarchaeota archaeon CR_4]